MSTHPKLTAPSDRPSLRQQALRANGGLVPIVLVSLDHCPFCRRLIQEQLVPRMKEGSPTIVVMEFDLSDGLQTDARGTRFLPSPREWALRYGFRFAPTVTAVDPDLKPVGSPLLGYSSVDFYSAYLEALIVAGRTSWKTRP